MSKEENEVPAWAKQMIEANAELQTKVIGLIGGLEKRLKKLESTTPEVKEATKEELDAVVKKLII